MKLFAKIAAAALLLIGTSQIARAADTYTPNCRIVQMPTGSNDTLWGTKANSAFAMLDQCISQGTVVNVTGGNVTLSTANNAPDQARSAIIAFTGTPGVTRTITVPNVSKLTWVANSSNSSLIFTAGAGTTVTVTSGSSALIYTDASTNVVAVINMPSVSQAAITAGLGSAANQPASAFMAGANNLSELTNNGVARTNLGLGSAATQSSAAFDAFGAAATAQTNAINASMQRASNGSDIANPGLFRTNLGLGTAATTASSAYDAAGAASTAQAAAIAASMQRASNGSDISNTTSFRSNLGLGSQATKNITVSTAGPSGGASNGDVWLQY